MEKKLIAEFNGFYAYAKEVKNKVQEIDIIIPYSEYEIDNIALGEFMQFKSMISNTKIYIKARKEGLGIIYNKIYS